MDLIKREQLYLQQSLRTVTFSVRGIMKIWWAKHKSTGIKTGLHTTIMWRPTDQLSVSMQSDIVVIN